MRVDVGRADHDLVGRRSRGASARREARPTASISRRCRGVNDSAAARHIQRHHRRAGSLRAGVIVADGAEGRAVRRPHRHGDGRVQRQIRAMHHDGNRIGLLASNDGIRRHQHARRIGGHGYAPDAGNGQLKALSRCRNDDGLKTLSNCAI